MTGNAPRTPVPDAPFADAEIADERSTVRARVPSQPRLDAPQRLEILVRRAKLFLEQLPKEDPRARLLGIAVMRRDETLLERLLDAASSAASPSTRPER
ncbi:MAG: hypothetical protein R3B13_00955 [Polyangiaceae bacterium]